MLRWNVSESNIGSSLSLFHATVWKGAIFFPFFLLPVSRCSQRANLECVWWGCRRNGRPGTVWRTREHLLGFGPGRCRGRGAQQHQVCWSPHTDRPGCWRETTKDQSPPVHRCPVKTILCLNDLVHWKRVWMSFTSFNRIFLTSSKNGRKVT